MEQKTGTEIEKLLNKNKFEMRELQIQLGKDRYESVVNEIREVLVRNGLNEFNSFQLLNHLSDIFRVERIHV